MNPHQAPAYLVRPTEIGAKILEIAERERALEPDMYIDRNLDYGDTEFRAQHGITGSRIREFFVQGVQGSWVTGWDQRSQTEKPPWCAAFASYCYRKAYEELGIPLPVAPKANVSGLCAVMQRIDRRREESRSLDGPELWPQRIPLAEFGCAPPAQDSGPRCGAMGGWPTARGQGATTRHSYRQSVVPSNVLTAAC